MTVTLKQRLELKLETCAELYAEGRVSRGEVFKYEVALSLGEDAGPIVVLPKPARSETKGEVK